MYPVLANLYDYLSLDAEQSFWFSFLYVAYYDIPSALQVFYATDGASRMPADWCFNLPKQTERRTLRGGARMQTHLESYFEVTQQYALKTHWLTDGLGKHPMSNFAILAKKIKAIWGNDRWASYKWIEILKIVHHMPVSAPDLDLRHCSGPRQGLMNVTGLHELGDLENSQYLAKRRLFPSLSWEEFETILCDFNSMCRGRYYVGHDIDTMQESIARSNLDDKQKQMLFDMRGKSFSDEYLGEHRGWMGVDKELNRQYAETGKIGDRGDL